MNIDQNHLVLITWRTTVSFWVLVVLSFGLYLIRYYQSKKVLKNLYASINNKLLTIKQICHNLDKIYEKKTNKSIYNLFFKNKEKYNISVVEMNYYLNNLIDNVKLLKSKVDDFSNFESLIKRIIVVVNALNVSIADFDNKIFQFPFNYIAYKNKFGIVPLIKLYEF